jgi:hypothetical protein
MSSVTTTFSTQLLGQTEKAANALLARLLAEPGLTEHQWIALTLAVTSADAIGRRQLIEHIAGALKIGEAEAQARLAELATARLLLVPDDPSTPVTVTDAGRRLHAQIRAATTAITERLWGDVPADDLATAGRVLGTVLARANAELATA